MQHLLCFSPIPLSPSGRPILLDAEIELMIQENVAVYNGDEKSDIEGTITVTSHRLLWKSPEAKTKIYGLSLSMVSSCSLPTKLNKMKVGSPKIVFHLNSGASFFKLSFREGGRDNFYSKVKSSLNEKAWVSGRNNDVIGTNNNPNKQFSTANSGISGILRNESRKAEKTDESLSEAFSDLQALMDKAKEMVSLSERFQSAKKTKEEDSDFKSLLMQMGIQSPVTKDSAGSLYHIELSKQIADWLTNPSTHIIKKMGGMIPLTDMYCIYNRARGTEMVSPEDLYRACCLFETLRLQVRMKVFKSGVIVIREAEQTEEVIGNQIAALIDSAGPQSAFNVATLRNISPSLAREQLLTAERQKLLCRDETFEGIVFYKNFFLLK